MDKDKLLTVLEEGLKLNRIDQKQYNTALDLFHIIYEEKAEDESSDAHAKLCTLINAAADYEPTKRVSGEEVIAAETKALDDFIQSHPVLKFSPSDLKHMNTPVDTHLHPYSLIDQELYREYYDV